MKIAILNYLAASHLLEREAGHWDAIVVLDSGLKQTAFFEKHSRRSLGLRFDDIQTDEVGKRVVTKRDVESALSFASGSERLLVCCRAGQSRSAALGFVVAYVNTGDNAAQALLDPKRHVPNPTVVKIGAQAIEDPRLLAAFDRWCETNSAVKLSDYYDQLESEYEDLVSQGVRNRITS